MLTATRLIQSIITNSALDSETVRNYGFANVSADQAAVLLELYKDMIINKHVSCMLLHYAYLKNKLDELIHKMNVVDRSGAYRRWKSRIGPTFSGFHLDKDLLAIVESFGGILANDQCLWCEKKTRTGTHKHCNKCGIRLCQRCITSRYHAC